MRGQETGHGCNESGLGCPAPPLEMTDQAHGTHTQCAGTPGTDAILLLALEVSIRRDRALRRSSTVILFHRCTRRTGLRRVQRFPGGVS